MGIGIILIAVCLQSIPLSSTRKQAHVVEPHNSGTQVLTSTVFGSREEARATLIAFEQILLADTHISAMAYVISDQPLSRMALDSAVEALLSLPKPVSCTASRDVTNSKVAVLVINCTQTFDAISTAVHEETVRDVDRTVSIARELTATDSPSMLLRGSVDAVELSAAKYKSWRRNYFLALGHSWSLDRE